MRETWLKPLPLAQNSDLRLGFDRLSGDGSLKSRLRGCADDKVHNRGRIVWCEWSMSHALFDDDLDFATELFVSLFNLERIVLEPRVEGAANVEKRHVGFGQRGEIVERLGFREGAAHARILSVDTGDFVRIFDGPGVHFAGTAARAFDHRLLRKAVADHVFVGHVPIFYQRAVGVGGYRSGDDVK